MSLRPRLAVSTWWPLAVLGQSYSISLKASGKNVFLCQQLRNCPRNEFCCMSGVTCPPLTWSLWLVEWQAFAWPSLGQGSTPRGRGQGSFIWTARIRDDRGWFLKEDQCAVISKGDWMLTRMNVHHSLSTLLFSPYLTVCDSESFPTESFHKKVLKDLSLRKFSPGGPSQKIPSSVFLFFPEGCL